MDIFTLAAKLTLDSASFDKGIEEAEGKGSKLGNVLGGIGNAAKTTIKVAGAALASAGSVVAGLTKSAVQAYGEYEQLVGGVETLFGTGGRSLEEYQKKVGITAKSTQKQIEAATAEYENHMAAQELVMKNAQEAYKTAGVDANQYMNTVTSFSAALISGLQGDTERAAEVSHMAMVDMADNANKMGTDMGSIQNAYQGFAKQNYTMLDNLNNMGALAA